MLEHKFKPWKFNVFCTPFNSYHQIQYFISSNMVDCVICGDANSIFTGVDFVQAFGSRAESLTTCEQVQMLIQKFGGSAIFSKLCIMQNYLNDSEPQRTLPESLAMLSSCNFNLLDAALLLTNQQGVTPNEELLHDISLQLQTIAVSPAFDFSLLKASNSNEISLYSNILISDDDLINIQQISGYTLIESQLPWAQSPQKARFELAVRSGFYRTPQYTQKTYDFIPAPIAE
ncbi:hypothetical protein SS50377_27111 [Spironucleus salmonicida]|nr:hypothetical protein SS50377_27111 [Spironucleus salmonicida]